MRSTTPSSSMTKATEETTPQVQFQHVSPTLRFDPTAGVVITEYFSSNGDIQTQLPSTASLAYLRMGLTATGEPKAPDKSASTENAEKPKEVLV